MSIEQFAIYFLREKYKTFDKKYKFCEIISEFLNGLR